jgi:hypothetical protein
MAIFYTDLALRQSIGNNFPGQPGSQQITNLPTGTGQTNALFEGPNEIIATYTLVGTEAVGDIINIGVLAEGVIVDPNGKVSSGVTAPGTTLTVAVGDNDLADPSVLPITNAAGLQGGYNIPTVITAPAWVSGTTYAAGNVVRDTATSSGIFVSGDVYMAVAATSGTTAPHSAATTVWMPIYQRYSGTINVAGASSNVAFAGGTQMYGGPASMLPYSVVPGQAALGLTANELLNQQYQVQKDCWLQARVLTASTLTAGTFLTFRIPIVTAN